MHVIRAKWPAPPGIVAGTSTRAGGASQGKFASLNLGDHVGDDPQAVLENRRQLIAHCAFPEPPRWLRQVHGTTVLDVATLPPPGPDDEPPVADAAVSQDGSGVLAILTADCLPIVVCSSTAPGLAAMHCGWRSLAGGIVARTIGALGADPAQCIAWLGPAISQPAFEVGDEVRDLFLAGVENAAHCFKVNERNRWQADLSGLARLYLEEAGLRQIFGGGRCTYSNDAQFFSYRRDGQCGRMATFIRRDKSRAS
ncbi:MAG TPA: peptidoglycan editing factor PgeF [Woeseiaceae bacterium]|nr:peptidoglycan editing factor PgeF [Woeseiaceae bacterium]